MGTSARVLLVFGIAAAVAVASSARATLYSVSRTFGGASLVGTVEVPIGSYTIQNASASPFSSVALILTVNGTPWYLNEARTDFIYGNGRFFIDATSTTLTFDTANADGGNPADLAFAIVGDDFVNRYAIGFDGAPGFEAAHTESGHVDAPVAFPTVFGTAIPEPSTASLLALGLIGLGGARRWFQRTGACEPLAAPVETLKRPGGS